MARRRLQMVLPMRQEGPRWTRGGKTEPRTATQGPRIPRALPSASAPLAHAPGFDARRARRGDRRREPRPARAAQLPSGVVVPRRRRRMGRDAGDGAGPRALRGGRRDRDLSLIHISEPTRLRRRSYAVFCLKKKKKQKKQKIRPFTKKRMKK